MKSQRSSRMIVVIMATVVLAISQSLYAANCLISGREAIAEARSKGLKFAITTNGKGQCDFHVETNAVVVAPAQGEQSFQCTISFFVGATLAEGWLNDGPIFDPQVEFEFVTPPKKNSVDPSFSVKVVRKQGSMGTLVLKNLQLRGPDCTKWNVAFQSPSG